jgi:pullulanase/glycogen debranching enzyme
VGDPCTRYNGSGPYDNGGFVIDDPATYQPVKVQKLDAPRIPLHELIIYEVMLDDFTAQYRGQTPPVRALADSEKLNWLKNLGVNAIELMPWTAWPGEGFSWGYDPFLFFAVEYRYVSGKDPRSKLDTLLQVINELHREGFQVIMDGVFNHTQQGRKASGFPYYWLYRHPSDCPFVGPYLGGGFFQDFDFENRCTNSFIVDVCKYWIDEFGIDGIRFDYTLGYLESGQQNRGLGRIIRELRNHLIETGNDDGFYIGIEHLPDNRYAAIDDCNRIKADSCWYDQFYWDSRNALYHKRDSNRTDCPVKTEIMRLMDSARDFEPGRVPTTYIENHDHAAVASNCEGQFHWYRSQPWAIALFTCAGAVLIHNGQEFADDPYIPEEGQRVKPRPVQWAEKKDTWEGRQCLALYQGLIRIRKSHPALGSPHFYPRNWEGYNTSQSDYKKNFNLAGYGLQHDSGIVIFHRWDATEVVTVALNFSDRDWVGSVPLAYPGEWIDLQIIGGSGTHGRRIVVDSANLRPVLKLEANWGHIFVKTLV